jgi:hypothetical protein
VPTAPRAPAHGVAPGPLAHAVSSFSTTADAGAATPVRAVRCADGWYDVGALSRLPALRKSHPELCLP